MLVEDDNIVVVGTLTIHVLLLVDIFVVRFYPLNELPTKARREQFEFDWQPDSTDTHRESARVPKSVTKYKIYILLVEVSKICSLINNNNTISWAIVETKTHSLRTTTTAVTTTTTTTTKKENGGSRNNGDVDSV